MRPISVVINKVASFEVINQEPPWISQGFGIYMEYTQMLVLGTIRYHIRTVITLRALKCHICWIQIKNIITNKSTIRPHGLLRVAETLRVADMPCRFVSYIYRKPYRFAWVAERIKPTQLVPGLWLKHDTMAWQSLSWFHYIQCARVIGVERSMITNNYGFPRIWYCESFESRYACNKGTLLFETEDP